LGVAASSDNSEFDHAMQQSGFATLVTVQAILIL
jgi:hypothetical protein